MSIGTNLYRLRKERNLTQEKLAEKLGVSFQTISAWERNEYKPETENLINLAEALDVSISSLVEERHKAFKTKEAIYDWEHMKTYVKTAAKNFKLNNAFKAVDFAVEAHKGQKRKKSDVPYIYHPLNLACHALAMGIVDDEIIAASLLHDVVEDCKKTYADLPVNDETRELVRLMTKDPHPKDKTAVKNAYYAELKKNPKAALVKCFDRVNNLSNMALGFTRDKMVEYVEEAEKYIVPLLRVINNEAPEYADPCWLLSYHMYSLLETYKRLL